jgi:hypothetical protein
VKNKRERSLPVRPPGVEKTSRLGLMDPVASGVKCGLHGGKNSRTKSWTVSLVEPQNQGRAGTTWEPSHEWRLAEATPSSRGLQWFTRKPLGYSVEPQKPRLKTRRGGAATQAGLTAQEGRSDRLAGLTAQGCGQTALVAGAEMLRSGGHASGSRGLRRG